ncbi:MAG: H-X9-DG-CTERM domain-containing protein, partial [Armatimonadota bacterium]
DFVRRRAAAAAARAGVSVFNRCLIEAPEGIIKGAANLMLVREMGRLTMASLRPSNDCTNNVNVKPVDPFLIAQDRTTNLIFSKGEYMLHANGSHVLFADGHVKLFDIDSFAVDPPKYMTPAVAYDGDATQQWYNYYSKTPTTPQERARNRQIAISP